MSDGQWALAQAAVAVVCLIAIGFTSWYANPCRKCKHND